MSLAAVATGIRKIPVAVGYRDCFKYVLFS